MMDVVFSKLLAAGRAAPGNRAAAGVQHPWWAICKWALCGKIIVAGPFFSEAAADLHLMTNRKQYGNARVTLMNGEASPEYRELLQAMQLLRKAK